MKKSLLALSIAGLAFASCQKDGATPASPAQPLDRTGKKYPVEIKLQQFVQQTGPMEKNGRSAGSQLKDPDLADKVAYIEYRVFNGSQLVSAKSQHKTDNPANFGSLRDSLPAGTYTVSLVASNSPILLMSDKWINFESAMEVRTDDVYRKSFSIDVSAGGSSTVADVTLERAMSKVELNILDLQQIQNLNRAVIVEVYPANYRIDIETGNADSWDGPRAQLISRSASGLYEGYVVPNTQANLVIRVMDNLTGTFVGHKEFPVTFERNKKLIVTGYMMAPPSGTNGNFDIQLNQAWDGQTEIEL